MQWGNPAHPQLDTEIQQPGQDSCLCPKRRPKRKQPKPTKTTAGVLTALTQQSSSASAKRRRRESNHQNRSPPNSVMLFIGPGMLCFAQQLPKCHCFGQRGFREVARAGACTHGSLGTRSSKRGQGTHVAVTEGTCFFRGSGSQSCCSSGGRRHHPVAPVEVGASRPSSICPVFLSVTTLSFFREGSSSPGHLGCIGIKVAGLLAKLVHQPSSPALRRPNKPSVHMHPERCLEPP